MKRLRAMLLIIIIAFSLFAADNPFVGVWLRTDENDVSTYYQFYRDLSFRKLVLYPRFQFFDYEYGSGRYEYEASISQMTLIQTYYALFRPEGPIPIVNKPNSEEYAFLDEENRKLRMGKYIFLKQGASVSLDNLLSNQKEIQENLFLDTLIDGDENPY